MTQYGTGYSKKLLSRIESENKRLYTQSNISKYKVCYEENIEKVQEFPRILFAPEQEMPIVVRRQRKLGKYKILSSDDEETQKIPKMHQRKQVTI